MTGVSGQGGGATDRRPLTSMSQHQQQQHQHVIPNVRSTSTMSQLASLPSMAATNQFPPTLGGSLKQQQGGGGKPVPMKLFATWEVERTPPNCIPRLCSLTLARLVLFNSLDQDLTSIIIAVKMQSSKRTLRSNEIPLPSSGLLDTELELTFSLQYPHFLKREGNKLQIMLQRRKKYKNRTILGYKTLATGVINMSQVLQRQMDQDLELVEGKGGGAVLGKVYMLSLTSQPVDHEEPGKQMVLGDQDRGEMYSDEEEDFSSPDEGSDSEPMLEDIRPNPVRRKSSKGLSNSAARQRNIRQKFVALLKRFKVNEPEELHGLKGSELSGEQSTQVGDVDPEEIEDLINELEDLSDSGPDVDTISVGSTPKPSLRPFFASSRSLIREALDNPAPSGSINPGFSIIEKVDIGSDHLSDDSSGKGGAVSDSHPETLTDPEQSDTQIPTSSPPQSGDEIRTKVDLRQSDRRSKLFSIKQSKAANAAPPPHLSKERVERLNSGTYADTSPRKVLLEQLSRLLPVDDSLPEQIILANTGDPQASHLASKLSETGLKVICTACPADVRASLTCLVTRLQKFCNTNIGPPNVMRVGLIGSDTFINAMLRPYVELFSSKPPDWQNLLRFYIIPLGTNSVSRGLAARCPVYASLFLDDNWRDLLEKAEPNKFDVAEIVSRVQQYLAAGFTTQLPIAEAMVTYKEKSSDEESSQVFVPFISDVRVGNSCSQDVGEGELEPGSSSLLTAGYHHHLHHHQLLERPGRGGGGSLSAGSGTGGAGGGGGAQTAAVVTGGVTGGGGEKLTPPSSPNISKYAFEINSERSRSESERSNSKTASSGTDSDLMELQLDYWLNEKMAALARINAGDNGGEGGGVSSLQHRRSESDSKPRKLVDPKSSIRTTFRSLMISHLAAGSNSSEHCFAMTYVSKEKRLGKAVLKIGKKKEKSGDSENKVQSIEGICRLICMTKSSQPLRVYIDGQEWSGVKFFQLSSHWQTHIKHFPVAVGTPTGYHPVD